MKSLFVVVVALLTSACGTGYSTDPACGPGTCTGCCDSDGICNTKEGSGGFQCQNVLPPSPPPPSTSTTAREGDACIGGIGSGICDGSAHELLCESGVFHGYTCGGLRGCADTTTTHACDYAAPDVCPISFHGEGFKYTAPGTCSSSTTTLNCMAATGLWQDLQCSACANNADGTFTCTP